jgi:uncharacterized protein YcsI (UPF0317 family)
MNMTMNIKTGSDLRSLVRSGKFNDQTAGQAPDFLQGNVVILPKEFASDFLQFCQNNPKPCPLIALSKPGESSLPELGENIDIRHDVPRYRIYHDGVLQEEVSDIETLWSDDLVTFVLGCSFTFEEALIRNGFSVRHIENNQNVPMFKCGIQTIKSGIFNGPLVVTMRPYKASDIPAVFDICAHYPHAHGTPVFWGNPADIGIDDLQKPDYGDPVFVAGDEVPVFWACGVTPQAAIERAKPRLCITHAPGHMLVTDVHSSKGIPPITGMQNFVENT